MVFLDVFVCDSGINDRLSLNLEKHSYISDCFSCQCLCASVLASTGLMCGRSRVRRGKGQPENTDCKFVLFHIVIATFQLSLFLGEQHFFNWKPLVNKCETSQRFIKKTKQKCWSTMFPTHLCRISALQPKCTA